jgi:hypothetical protein
VNISTISRMARAVSRGPERWQVLIEQALGDGLLDAALLTRYTARCFLDLHSPSSHSLMCNNVR